MHSHFMHVKKMLIACPRTFFRWKIHGGERTGTVVAPERSEPIENVRKMIGM